MGQGAKYQLTRIKASLDRVNIITREFDSGLQPSATNLRDIVSSMDKEKLDPGDLKMFGVVLQTDILPDFKEINVGIVEL